MKKISIITGASSGIGEATAKKLCYAGYIVYAIARDFKKCKFKHENFFKISCDLMNIDDLEIQINNIIQNNRVDILINNAGTGYFGMHEDIKVKNIDTMTKLNLTIPMILSKLLTKPLKKTKGKIIHISSISALKSSPYGSAYSATKAGLIKFNENFFEEVRKSGIQSTVISPGITDTAFFDNLNFYPDEDERAYLLADDIANNILWLITQPKNIAITHLQIEPQLNKIAKRKY